MLLVCSQFGAGRGEIYKWKEGTRRVLHAVGYLPTLATKSISIRLIHMSKMKLVLAKNWVIEGKEWRGEQKV